jgi:hypothetical protein
MSLSDLAAIGGLVSSLAVCGSLVYLGLQMRQAERNQRSLMNQGISTRGSDIIMFMAQPHISTLFGRMIEGETDFSQIDIMQLSMALRLALADLQDSYIQHKAGLADKLSFDGTRHIMRLFLGYPVLRVLWQVARPTFPDEIARMVDGIADRVPLTPPADLPAMLKHGLARLHAQT